MGKINDPKKVQYLALEGGGGKGVTYLGAIRALEKLGVLPIDINKAGNNQIKGISGASAGAITALMLSMGLNSKELEKVLSRPQDFNAFFDGPSMGIYRSVNAKNKPDLYIEKIGGRTGIELVRQRADKIWWWDTLGGNLILLLNDLFGGLPPNHPAIQQIGRSKDKYLFNLIFDRGLFPGIKVRSFFSRLISGYLSDKILKYTGGIIASSPNGGDLSFELFYEFTGVDLVVTGANITKRRPAIFSRRHTPKFPVAEAVGISMNLPFLFKPVYVQAGVAVNQYNQRPDDYHGFWVDGGLLNNLPLHAFDEFGPLVSDKYPQLRPLHPSILGLRLTSNPEQETAKTSQAGVFDVIKSHAGNIFETLMFPSEGGQIRTKDEAEQTIDLFTYNLETTDFAPSNTEVPVREAEKKVLKYFNKSTP